METHLTDCCNLEQEIQRLLQNVKPAKTIGRIAKVTQWSEVVRNVLGVVRLAASPHYSFTLDTGKDDKPYVLQLALVDFARHICQWISVVGKHILINRVLVVCETFQVDGEDDEMLCVNLIADWKDLRCTGVDFLRKEITENGQHLNEELCKRKLNTTKEGMEFSSTTCHILVHHVSMPFWSCRQSSTVCLALISYTDRRQLEVKLWLILTSEEVAWRELLVQNREYIIRFPSRIDKYFFDRSAKPLNEIFGDNSELKVVFHHSKMFPTMNGCTLPVGSKIYLTSNSDFSTFVYRFVKDPFSVWYSVDEADSAPVDLVTLCGQVTNIMYDEEYVIKSCYLCIQAKPKRSSEQKFTFDHPWMNPWMSPLSIGKGKLIELPSVEKDHGTMKTGVPGKLVQIIKLKDLVTGNECSVYLKHSYICSMQQLFRLTPGIILSITHLNRRCTRTGKYYFISTVLSAFKVLAYSNSNNTDEGWGLYGLKRITPHHRDKMWGVLEALNLSKVTITAKCTNCKAPFYQGVCSNSCSLPDSYVTSSYAIGWLQVVLGNERICMEKLIIKGDFIKKLLCIPNNVWQLLQKAAAEEEIICFIGNEKTDESHCSFGLSELLSMYCNIPKPNGKFYVSVRLMSSSVAEEDYYYCINLESIEKRLPFLVGHVKYICCMK